MSRQEPEAGHQARALQRGASLALLLGLLLLPVSKAVWSAGSGAGAASTAASKGASQAQTAAEPTTPRAATAAPSTSSAPSARSASLASSASSTSSASSAASRAAAISTVSAASTPLRGSPALAAGASSPAQARPVSPPAVVSTIPLPALQCRAAQREECVDPDPLSLERRPDYLPNGVVGRRYQREIRALGGRPPYVFRLVEGHPPEGLELDPAGTLHGTPAKAGLYRFRVGVEDQAGRAATQAYVLRVQPLRKPEPAASAPSSPSPTPPLGQVDKRMLGQVQGRVPTAVVYQLQPAQLDALALLLKPASSGESGSTGSGSEGAGDATASGDSTAPTAGADAAAGSAAGSAADPGAPTPPPPAGMAWTEDQNKQLLLWLEPLMGIEYPSRSLFLAAVDALACAQLRQLVTAEAQRLRQPAPDGKALARSCAKALNPGSDTAGSAEPAQRAATPASRPTAARRTPPASATTADMANLPAGSAASAPANAPGAAAAGTQAGIAAQGGGLPASAEQLPLSALPAWLLPPALREWLADAAARERVLWAGSPSWSATPDCRCANARARQVIYAVAPNWLRPEPPQPMDFSLIHRITPFALPLEQDLVLPSLAEDQVQYIDTARRFETRIDFGLYRRDWRFLATEPAQARETLLAHLSTQVPRQARELLDTPLSGWKARSRAWLPGFAEVQYAGDGLTVYFDQVPEHDKDAVLADRFASFYPRFVKGLGEALAANPKRRYVINLMLDDRQLAAPGPFSVDKLFELLKAVEKPEMLNGRIVETNSDYKRKSNVQLRFLVLLSEPSTDSKKRLRSTIEDSPALKGGDRRIFLRSVVPLLVLPQLDMQQYQDDLVYVQDNFDGIGFWPSPLVDGLLKNEQRDMLRRVFVGDPGLGISEAVCSFVCPNRWLLRLAFDLLILAGLLTWAAFQWNCEWRAKYGRLALLGGIPPVVLGAALLECDPALAGIRNSNAQLMVLIAIPVIAALAALLRKKVEKP